MPWSSGPPLYLRAPPAHFHCLMERLVSMFFFPETGNAARRDSPLNDKPCGLVAVTEYSNPMQILEYLHDVALLLKMKPVVLKQFPYLGAAGQGSLDRDGYFGAYKLAEELAQGLVAALSRPRA